MVFLASEGTGSLVLEEQHLKQGLEVLRQSEIFMPRVLRLITSNDKGALIEIIRQRIAVAGGAINRSILLRSLSHRLDARELSDLLETLIQSKEIVVLSTGHGIVYKFRGVD